MGSRLRESRDQKYVIGIRGRDREKCDLASYLHMAIVLHRIPELSSDRQDRIADATRSQGIDLANNVT